MNHGAKRVVYISLPALLDDLKTKGVIMNKEELRSGTQTFEPQNDDISAEPGIDNSGYGPMGHTDAVLRILLLEDSEDDALIIQNALKKYGLSIRCEVVETEEQFLASLFPLPDVVISDFRLPQFNGWRALELLRAESTELPFILVSGTIGEENAAGLMRSGANDYILKGSGLSRLGPAVVREVRDAEHRRARRAAEYRAGLADQALQNATDGVFITDANLKVLYVNPAYCKITGYKADALVGKALRGISGGTFPDDFLKGKLEATDSHGVFQHELNNWRANGESYRELISISAIRDSDGGVIRLIGTVNDITKVKAYEQKLDHLAYHDEVSGLPNRRRLERYFAEQSDQAKRSGRCMALMFLDLDSFKLINDSLGHAVGDTLLREVGTRIRSCLRDGDVVGRLSGDEFVVLIPDLKSSTEAVGVSGKIMDALLDPFLSHPHQTHVSASIGVAICPADGKNFEEVLHSADQAMYRAKKQGRNLVEFYRSEFSNGSTKYFQILNAMHSAISRGEFQLVYQPVVDLPSGVPVSLEALIRWDHPEYGTISPAEFIPIAEKSGLIGVISDWVLETACSQAAQWHRANLFSGRIAVNLCARELRLPNMVERVIGALKRNGLSPQNLALELTESTLMESPERAREIVTELRNLGIAVAIDDFGTGYSSLSYLKQFPASVLKIDRSFVDGLPLDQNSAVIVTTIITMARSLGLDVIAEGVESADQATFLMDHGCKRAQGNYYARPLAVRDIEILLAKHSKRDRMQLQQQVIRTSIKDFA